MSDAFSKSYPQIATLLQEEEDPGYVDKAEYGYKIHPDDMVLHQFWGNDKGALVTVNTWRL